MAGVQLPPHVRHELVVLQPDEEVEGEGLEGVEGVAGNLWFVEAVCGTFSTVVWRVLERTAMNYREGWESLGSSSYSSY